MGNAQRHQYQYDRPRFYRVDSAVVIETGDLLWLNTDDARGAADYTWDTSLAITSPQFQARFIGVAAQASASGDTDDIRVSTAGVFEFPCASSTFNEGDFVGVNDNAGGTALVDQELIKVTDPRQAIGRVVKAYASAVTTILVEIFPKRSGNGAGIPKVEIIPISCPNICTGADVVIGFVFGKRFCVIEWQTFVCIALSANLTTLTFEKDTVDLTETHAIASAAAIGEKDTTIITTAGEALFESDGVLDVESDGACTTGVVQILAIGYEVGAAAGA